MRVLYDISVLGEGLYNPQARTGVSRAIDNLRQALAVENEIELSCCAFRSLENHSKILANRNILANFEEGALRSRARLLPNAATRLAGQLYPRQVFSRSARIGSRLLNGVLKGIERFSGGVGPADLEGIDIFHATFFPVPEALRGRQTFKRFIMVHDLIPLMFPAYCSAAQQLLARETIECIGPDDGIFTNSESTKADLCNYAQFDPARVFVTPLAASKMFRHCNEIEQLTRLKERYVIPAGHYVLSVCTFEPRKNIEQVVRSFAELIRAQRVSDLNLVLVGTKGWGFERIDEAINHDPLLRNRIIVTDYVADEDLPVLYSGALMFVYPSFYEGFGLPPLEAMQCGTPVITSNTSSLPEVVGGAGLMIDPRDGEALSQAMWSIYSQPATREDLSAKSLDRARLFSWEKSAQLTVAAYKSALGC